MRLPKYFVLSCDRVVELVLIVSLVKLFRPGIKNSVMYTRTILRIEYNRAYNKVYYKICTVQ